MSPIITVLLVLVAAAVCGALGFYLGGENRKRTAEAKIGSAEDEAKRIVNDAIKTAEAKRKETIVEAKDEAFKLKSEADKEIKDRRAEITRQERRMDQKEEALDKRSAAMERKEEDLKRRTETVEARLDELEQLKMRQTEKLETIAAMSQEDARAVLLKQVDDELTHEKAMKISAYQANMKDECDNIARELVGQAIARCAADATSEATVSVVPLPSDEMKGRIIGREGRNIRALETATGCDLIIDDTPEAITLSSFDQTRREVARMALERLIADGRIHPARIEETVDKCRRELEIQMKREGDKAVMDLGIHSLHPDLVKLIGRLKYRTSYGQNVLSHSLEVAWLAGLMAGELGVNVQLARRAGLLHDIGKALDHEIEGSHVQIGVDICQEIPREPAGHPRYRGPPRRRGAQDHPGLHHHGRRCHLRCPPRCPPREHGELHQASGNAGSPLQRLRGRRKLLRCPGWPRGPHPGPAGQGQRRSGHPAGAQCRQKDRERVGLPRPDQGQRHTRKPRYRVRKIISAACRLPVGCFFIIRPPLGGGLFHISILHISPLRFIINKNTVIRRGASRRRKTCRKTPIKKFWASWVGWGLPPAATCTRC